MIHQRCEPLQSEMFSTELLCKETGTGKGYAGTLQETKSGHQCEPWIRIPAQIRASVWTSQNPEIIEQMLSSLNNYCRLVRL